jgi:quinol monooxygenase YgiN
MSEITMFVKLPLKEGKFDELKAAFDEVMMPQVAKEEGTLAYVICQDNADPNVARVYEAYTDQAALEAHSNSDAMAALFGRVGDLMDGAPEMHLATPVLTK